jgi:hypothetical protein
MQNAFDDVFHLGICSHGCSTQSTKSLAQVRFVKALTGPLKHLARFPHLKCDNYTSA